MKKVPLKDISTAIQYGFTEAATSNAVGPKFLRITDIQDGNVDWDKVPYCVCNEVEKFKLSEGDIVFARTGATTGKSYIIGDCPEAVFASYLIRVRVKDYAHPKYVYYFFQSEAYWSQVRSGITGSTQGGLNATKLSELVLPVPDLQTQKQIAQVLEDADRARQQRKAANVLTEQFLQSSFLHLFGDPVQNEKGWQVKKIGELSSLVSSGSTPLGGQSVYKNEGIVFIRSQNILMNEIDYSDVAFISDDIHNKMKRTWVKDQDVLLNITGASIGRVAYYRGENDKANVNQHVCIIRAKQEEILPIFLSRLMSNDSFQNLINSNNSGATRQAFNFQQIKNFEIIVPTLSLQQQFASLVTDAEALRQKQLESERELEHLFQALLQQYFSSEAGYVGEMERPLSQAAEPEKQYAAQESE